ncbi:MAG: hypothetical protein DI534_08840 [Leifsonia xyli]|nr:MAG: hypothetical protein DI534_08840 [Leifsonia xyli]
MRALISLIIAVVASLGGTLLLAYGGGNAVIVMSQVDASGDVGVFPLWAGLGALLLAVAGASVRWSSLGAFVAGGAQLGFALLALLVPAGADGSGSPAIWLLDRLLVLDRGLASGAFYLVAFGGSLLIGAALLGVGVGALRRRPRLGWRIASGIGGLLALGAASWSFAAGGEFARIVFQGQAWEFGVALAVVLAGLSFGVLLLPSGRSPIGAWVAGGVIAAVGVILLVADPSAYTDAPSRVLLTLPILGWSGTILAVGLCVLGLALGVTLRPVADAASDEEQPASAM